MHRSLVALFGLIVGLSVVTAGVTVADPPVSRPDPPRVDASEAPASVATAALEQTRYRDYAVTIDRTATDGTDLHLRLAMDNTDREYLTRRAGGPGRHRAEIEYGNPFRSWVAGGTDPGPADWRSDSSEWGDVHLIGGPFDLGAGAATTVRRNESTVVLDVTDTRAVYRLFFHVPNATASLPDARAHAVLAVDRAAGVPLRVTVETVEPSGTGGPPVRTRTVMTFDGWDETDVSRPVTIPYSMTELAEDAAELDGRGGVPG